MSELPQIQRTPNAVEAGALMPWRILELALRNGEFRVSWRYRDETLLRRCSKLRRQGWLRRAKCAPGEFLFVPSKAARDAANG